MKIRILHLYEDLMNRSGDTGNLRALRARLLAAGASVTVDHAGFGEPMPFCEYDVICACDAPLPLLCRAMRDIAPRADELAAAIAIGKVFLLTGSARALLGGELRLASGSIVRGAGLLAETHREISRFTADVIATRPGMGSTLYIGSYDRTMETDAASEKPLFQMVQGVGDRPGALFEGVRRENLYATYMLGPVLVRNPELMDEILEKLLGKIPPRAHTLETEAKELALRELRGNR